MEKRVKLSGEDLKLNFEKLPQFETTEGIEAFKSIIGQKRAEESIEIGLKMDKKEYNIFITGHSGIGKTGYIVKKIEDYAKNMPAPEDLCYVYNFEDSNIPMFISLKTGTAIKFKEELNNFIKKLFKEVPLFFNSQTYEREKNLITDKYEEAMIALSEGLNKVAKTKNFSIKETSTGDFVFIPMVDDKEMSSKEYADLSKEEKEDINKTASDLRDLSVEVIKKTKKMAKSLDRELKELDDNIAENIVMVKIEQLVKNYGFNEKIIKYLSLLKKDLIENIAAFLEKEDEDKNVKEVDKLFFRRFDVNVLVCNSADKGAPVIFADSTEFGSLFGKIEYENKLGNLITDFTLIKPGYLHQANGGYLLIKAHQLLSNGRAWEVFKKCLNLEIIFLQNPKAEMEMLPIITLNPENVPLKTKVILLGSNLLYSLLLQKDMEFEKLFRVKAEFDSRIEKNEKTTEELVGFLSNYVNQNNLLPITRDGTKELLKYSIRLSENRNYFSSISSKLLQLVDIGHYFAGNANSKVIDSKHIKLALEETEAMHGLIKKKVLEMYKNRKYVVDLKGTRVGQINGLSVMDYGDITIGQQHKITVNTFAGREGVINIERETNMSGSIHDKGVLILSGFIGEFIGQTAQISFNASITFEQLYSGIDGDSASAAELLALLSSLGDIPLKQSLAITGSVNQKGEIQPIGGVNSKIEGYFDICSIFGLDGSHGVIIPSTNEEDLVLKDKVIEAVEKGLFNIYTVSTIEEALQILVLDSFRSGVKNNLLEGIKDNILGKLEKYNNILNK